MSRIERAAPADANACAEIARITRAHSLPFLTEIHAAEEYVRFYEDHVFTADTVFVARDESARVVGFIAFAADGSGWVNHLYLLPEFQRRGMGTFLLDEAKRAHARLMLWTFQRNTGAIRFYERAGFRVVRLTDGSSNEEKEPDVLLQWDR